MIGIIIAIGLALGAAFGIGKIGMGIGDGFKAIGNDIGKAIIWLTVIMGIAIVVMTVLFFMTRSKASVSGQGAVLQGGGAVQK